MSAGLSPGEALSRIPGWSGARVLRQVHGGLNNRSFVVERNGREAVLRLDTEYTSTFGLDRSTEVRIHSAAAKQHLAPEVLFAEPDAGILLYDYLAGPVWSRASLDDPHNLDLLAALLREVHTLPAAGVTLDAEAAAERYAAAAYGNSGLSPFASRCLRIVRETPAAGPLACCHNDIVAANVVGSSTLKLLDWEYAGDNDPFFDLASPIAYHDLGSKQEDRLLASYAGGSGPEARERLDIQVRRYDALQWLWFAARAVASPNERDRAALRTIERRITGR